MDSSHDRAMAAGMGERIVVRLYPLSLTGSIHVGAPGSVPPVTRGAHHSRSIGATSYRRTPGPATGTEAWTSIDSAR